MQLVSFVMLTLCLLVTRMCAQKSTLTNSYMMFDIKFEMPVKIRIQGVQNVICVRNVYFNISSVQLWLRRSRR